jgi:ATP-dependent DNA helicase RecQ
MLDGLTIVISPLISLMKDQIDKLRELKINSACINSSITPRDQQDILEELQFCEESENPIRFLYIAPERLNSEEFIAIIRRVKIALIAIDEAHCVSQW